MSKIEIIDVVLPFHRGDKFLFQAVESIKNQNYCSVNLILVDDRKNSSRLGLELPRGTKMIKTEGVGYRAALKAGLEQCQAQFVAFQDSDDISNPNRLERQVKKLKEGELDLVFCQMKTINSRGEKTRVSRPTPLTAKTATEALLIGSYGADSTWLIKSENLADFFQFSYQSIDWATALIKFPTIRVDCVQEKLYLYRKHSNQMTANTDYSLDAFNDIYPLWLNLNNSMGLPELSKVDAATISFPPVGRRWNSTLQNWTTAFLDRIEHLGNDELRMYEAMFGQRALQSFKHNGVNREFLLAKKYIHAFMEFQIRIQPTG